MKTIDDIVRWRLCVGCGVCQSVCQKDNIVLVDIIDEGIRPIRRQDDCLFCSECVQVCPGQQYPLLPSCNTGYGVDERIKHPLIGPYLELWEGNAVDSEMHDVGSSGGALTALSSSCLREGEADGVIHIGAAPGVPYKNKTFFSRTTAELIERAGSRYSPASPGDSLRFSPEEKKSCVFIGKPCDVAGLRKAQDLRASISENVKFAFTLFCAGTPSTRGTLDLLNAKGVDGDNLKCLRFRGRGWPGDFQAIPSDGRNRGTTLSYMDSWSFLQGYRPYRCYLCPDATGELADISCGDPWYRSSDSGDPGKSLIVVRTELGREVVRKAIDAGLLDALPINIDLVIRSQVNLLDKRKGLWGRLAAMKIFLIPAPVYEDFPLRDNWVRLSLRKKCRAFFGTLRRILTRSYFIPMKRKHL